MGVATGCGCKEVYRFPHTTYPYSSCICSFLQQHPYFLFIKKNVYVKKIGERREEEDTAYTCNYICTHNLVYMLQTYK